MKKYIILICTLFGTIVGGIAGFLTLAYENSGAAIDWLHFVSWGSLIEYHFSNCGPNGCIGTGVIIMWFMHFLVVYSIYGLLVGLFLKYRIKTKS